MWLCQARRVMSTAELSDALAFQKGRGSKLDKYRPPLNMGLDCCHGLVVLSAETGYIELAHYSIQEYLESHSSVLFPSHEQEIALECLQYLMLEEFQRGPEAIDVNTKLDQGTSTKVSFRILRRTLLGRAHQTCPSYRASLARSVRLCPC